MTARIKCHSLHFQILIILIIINSLSFCITKLQTAYISILLLLLLLLESNPKVKPLLCISIHTPVNNKRICFSKVFAACLPLMKATSEFGFGRRLLNGIISVLLSIARILYTLMLFSTTRTIIYSRGAQIKKLKIT